MKRIIVLFALLLSITAITQGQLRRGTDEDFSAPIKDETAAADSSLFTLHSSLMIVRLAENEVYPQHLQRGGPPECGTGAWCYLPLPDAER